MKKKIHAQLLLISAFVLVLALTLTYIAYHAAFHRQAQRDVETLASVVAASYEEDGSQTFLRSITQEGLRITVIDPTGTVLFESDSDRPMENHLDRPEIEAALRDGSGSGTRNSSTLGYSTYYHAILLADGCVLRVAMRAKGLHLDIAQVMPMLLLIALCSIVLAHFLAKLLTAKLIMPIERIGEEWEQIPLDSVYPELRPFAENFKQRQQLRREAEEMRRDFTANVSHELKTPLTSISGYAEMIESGMARAEDVPQFATRIRREATRLLQLISDIIDLSRLDAKEDRSAFERVDLRQIADTVCELLERNAAQSGVSLQVLGEPLFVSGVPQELEELCYNLCDNAIRYNRPGGRVELSAVRVEGRAALLVRDTGIGIPKGEETRIFERFYRVDKGRSRKVGGTGLGLAIVKHIAIRHGAEVRVLSELGQGTTVTVLF